MKALSIRHPSIDVLLLGRRSVEVRRAATRHRGDLLLHASASFGPAGPSWIACARSAWT